jgi:FkbM family methyltransferase
VGGGWGGWGGECNIVIYGCGTSGKNFVKYFLEVFRNSNVINCFLDKNTSNEQTCLGYFVYRPDDPQLSLEFRKDVLVVIAILLDDLQYNEVVESLKKIGYTRFENAMPYFTRLLFFSQETNKENIIAKEIDNVASAFELMNDKHSEDVFISLFNAHATVCYDIKKLSAGMIQYVDVNVPFRHNYRSFIDCGAFTGDTFEDLIKWHSVEQYFGFEPDALCYAKLSQNVDTLREKTKHCVLLPLGVGDKNEYLRFSSTGDGIGKINDTGNEFIQTVRLDDTLKDYDDLFIKMDIESTEISALKGAQNIIKNTAPDLAISVYHKISDLWRIPLLLKEWVPEYKFYMRSHNAYSIDTVLYATLGS